MRFAQLILICSLFCFNNYLSAQEREWKPKSFDSLGVDSEIDYLDEDESNALVYSSGYFPIPMSWQFTVGLMFQGDFLINSANNILPTGLVKTNRPYSASYSREDDYLIFKEKFSDDEESASLSNEAYCLGLDYKLTPNIGLPVIFRANTLITWTTALLYSEDNSKSYLDYNNNQKNYLEIGNILLEETMLEVNAGLSIPIYGVFINPPVDLSSTYSLYVGFHLAEVLTSSATQYLQIGDVKEKLRYENGLDTVNLISQIELPTLLKSRTGIEIGLSTNLDIQGYGALFELKALFPSQSILTDERWKQTQIRIGTIFYFGGVFR